MVAQRPGSVAGPGHSVAGRDSAWPTQGTETLPGTHAPPPSATNPSEGLATTVGSAGGPSPTRSSYGADPLVPLAAGTVIADTFVVRSILGVGGMGVVYAAEHRSLERLVALKLHKGASGGADAAHEAARLEREAKAMARINHPHVIAVYDVGRIDDSVFIAMELVDGGTLAAACQQQPWRSILALYNQAAAGLAAAHDVGLVHRDFKPHNVLVGRDGRVRVADFGLARVTGASVTASGGADLASLQGSVDRLTATGAIVGTPRYMAPEQFAGGRVDARADQFSFCVALYEALWGKPPFEASTAGELLYAMTTRGPTPPPSSPIPGHVWEAIARGLSAEPSGRFVSMRELSAALNRPARPSGAALLGIGSAALLLVVGVGVGGWLLLRDTSDSQTQDPAVAVVAAQTPDSAEPKSVPETATPADPAAGPDENPDGQPTASDDPPSTNTPPTNTPPTATEAKPDPAARDAALDTLSQINMFEDPLEMMKKFGEADAAGADGLFLAAALTKGIMPKDTSKLPPQVPAWDHSQTLLCGNGENLLVSGLTLDIAEGPAFLVSFGCVLRVENCTITADTIISTNNSKSVTLASSTVTAKTHIVAANNSSVHLEDVTMTAPTEGAAVVVSNGSLTLVDSDLSGRVGLMTVTAASVDTEGGSLTGTDAAVIAGPNSEVRTQGTTLHGATIKKASGRVVAVAAPAKK